MSCLYKNNLITKFNMYKVLIRFAICIACFCSCSLSKLDKEAKSGRLSYNKTEPLYLEIEKLGYELTNKEHVPGVTVAIIRNGELAWTQCIGYADLENKRPVTTKTIFNIGYY